jgi:hypothetical protein
LRADEHASTAETIYVMDRIVLRPGMLEPYRRAWEERYLPGARARGMELVRAWVTPPVEVSGESNEVIQVWALSGAGAFWAMRAQAGADPSVAAWWQEIDRYALRRERCLLSGVAVPD